MKKTTALTVTVLAIATFAGTCVAQSAYSFAQAPTSSVAQAKSSWENSKLVLTLPTVASYVKFSSNGLLLVANGERGKAIQLWDVTKGKLLSSIKADNTTSFGDVAISPDGQFVASIIYSEIDQSIAVGLWNSKTGEAVWKKPIVTNSAEFRSPKDSGENFPASLVSSLEFSPNGQFIASGVQKIFASTNPQIQLWDVATGKKRFVFRSNIKSLRKLRFSPDSKVLASLGFNEDILPKGTYNWQGLIQLWNPNTGQLLHTLKDDLIPISMVFSPDSQTLTSLSKETMMYDAHLRTWDVKTGRTRSTVPVSVDRTDYLFSLSPDAKTYLTSGQVAGSRIINAQIRKEWRFPGADVYSAERALFSPDGQMLAIPTATGIPIWQALGN
jgi:WD40 repeat protein